MLFIYHPLHQFWSKAVGLEVPPEDLDPTMALIIDDGSKRARKQVQAFDPLREDAEAEHRRLEAVARKKQDEKEEKESLNKMALTFCISLQSLCSQQSAICSAVD